MYRYSDALSGDRGTILNPLLDNKRQFLIRLVGSRHLLYRGRRSKPKQLAESCPLPYADRVVKEQKGKEKQYEVEFGFRTVQMPHRSEHLYLVVVKGVGEEPLLLVTGVTMRKKLRVLWWALDAYLTRWRVEETIRYIKQCYDLEDIRVMTYERLQTMAALVLAPAYFTAVHLGLRSQLEILAGHALRAAKCIFGIPNFRYYALTDGIKDILSHSRRGLQLKVTGKQPQLELPLLL